MKTEIESFIMRTYNFLKQNNILILILLFGAMLRLYHIDFQSVWLDEIHTLNESNPNLNWSDFYNSLLASDPHPPLYFAFVRILFAVFGYTTLILRLFSAFLGIAGLYAIYVLAKEMHSKNIGLIAAFLLSINYFHIYYSQDGRPYIFLVLFTILSFYRLIIFIKQPNYKNAIWYGLFSTLMIYGHFFGLFVLFAQILILMFFFILEEKQNRLKFFISSLVSGIIILLLYIPAYGLLLKSMNIKEFWIPAPTLDVYTLIIKEFFGNSELILLLVGIIITIYFVKLSTKNNFTISYKSIIKHKYIFGFIISMFWIIIVLLVPLIRSYLAVPMLISRYFIVVLPSIIIILAIGIYQFKNRLIKVFILIVFFIFSMTDLLVIKKYYHSVNKAQFREATNFIIQNNQNHTQLVSRLGWYMPFFLKNDSIDIDIINKPIDVYLLEMQQDSTKIQPFWYIDAFGTEYKLDEKDQDFIDHNFYIENNYDGFQIWTKHFVLLKDKPQTLDISKYNNLQKYNGDGFMFNIETFSNLNNRINLTGWAYFDKQDATKTSIDVLLLRKGEIKAKRIQNQKVIRSDVTTYFKSDYNLSNSGFKASYNTSKLELGKYQIAIYLHNEDTKKEGLVLTDILIDK